MNEKEKAAKAAEEAAGKKGEFMITTDELAKLIEEGSKKAAEEVLAPIKEDVAFVRKGLPTAAKDVMKLEGVEKAAAWIRALGQGDFATVKALSEGVDADGGFVVPDEFRALVIEKLIKTSVIRPNATVLPMVRDSLELPTEGNAVTASFTAENAAIPESNPTFGLKLLNVNKLTGLSKMSRELLADAAIPIVNYVAAQFAKAFQIAEDKAFMTGSGTGEPKGIRTETFVTVAQAGANLVAEDLIDLFYTLPVQYRRAAQWLLANDIIKAIRKLKDADGRFLWTDGFNAAPDTILGRPVLEQADIPTNLGVGTDESEIFFGDISFYVIGDKEAMSVEQSTQAGTAFENHQMWLKVIERLDGRMTQTDPMVLLDGVK